jgi:hypothetical protein
MRGGLDLSVVFGAVVFGNDDIHDAVERRR